MMIGPLILAAEQRSRMSSSFLVVAITGFAHAVLPMLYFELAFAQVGA
jgi:hypothetical protein